MAYMPLLLFLLSMYYYVLQIIIMYYPFQVLRVSVCFLRQPCSSSPLGQSGMLSQRNSAGMHMFLAQRYCVLLQPVCGSTVPGTKLPQSSSSEPSTQSASPSQCQLWGTHSNKYLHWNCPESHVGGTEVTGAKETVKYDKNDKGQSSSHFSFR